MGGLGVMMEATKVLAEESENPTKGSGPGRAGNRLTVSIVHNADDGPAAGDSTVVNNRVGGTETCLQSNLNSNRGLGVMDEETGDGGIRIEKNGEDSFCLNNVASEGEHLNESGNGRWNGEKLEDGNYGFKVGDFVWGKIKSHPWWPGQVYDPRDASEFAVKHSQEGRLLVAFYGDGSCSWCLPSQLVPFIDNYSQMSSDGSSKSFVNAIQRAVDEIGRLVESKLTCKCLPMEKRNHLARPMVANAGVKTGMLVPEVDVHRLPIPEFEPDEILSKVLNFAKAVCVDNMFELGILRSWLSAFYYAKCGCPLAVYSEPLHIEGLEDNDEKETVISSGFCDPIEVPGRGPQEEDWASSPTLNSAKAQALLDDKIYHRRKQRSVAELMDKNSSDKPRSKKRSILKEGKYDWKLGRKRRVDGFDTDCTTDKKPKKIEVAVARDASLEAKEELEKVTSPRERKKSKYLSPPYTNLNWKIVNSASKMELESDKKITQDSSPVAESKDGTSDDTVANNRLKLTFSVSDVNIPLNELLSELEFAALDPFHLKRKGCLDMVWGFISAFRTSTYLHGSDYEVFNKCERVNRKRKSLPSLMANQEMENEQKPDRSKSKKASEFSNNRAGQESGPSQPADDLVSDVRVIRQKLDVMTTILGSCGSKFSMEEKCSLKDDMKCLMNIVETASEKVRIMAQNACS